jgi:hypothetical protein
LVLVLVLVLVMGLVSVLVLIWFCIWFSLLLVTVLFLVFGFGLGLGVALGCRFGFGFGSGLNFFSLVYLLYPSHDIGPSYHERSYEAKREGRKAFPPMAPALEESRLLPTHLSSRRQCVGQILCNRIGTEGRESVGENGTQILYSFPLMCLLLLLSLVLNCFLFYRDFD